MEDSNRTNDEYFANLDSSEITSNLTEKVKNYQDYLIKSGKLTLLKNLWATYYRPEYKIGITQAGDRGQYRQIGVNHFKSIIQGLIAVVCQQRPSFKPVAINSDYSTLSQTKVCNSVLEYYMRDKHLEDLFKRAVETGIVQTEAYCTMLWDANKGDPIAANEETGQIIHDGDVVYGIYSPVDAIKDITKTDSDNDWLILRDYKNKWDFIAEYPEKADDIKGLTIDSNLQRFRFGHMHYESSGQDTDIIPVYTFIHKKTPAVPNGRIVKFLDEDTILFDSPLPYQEFPVFRLSPSDKISNNAGYSVAIDLLGLQHAYDRLCSTILTNQAAFGVQNVALPIGSQIKVEEIIEGLNAIKCDLSKGVPVALNLTQTPAEVFNFLTTIEKAMEKISGINATLRGQPEGQLSSGTALAFVQSQSLVFNNPLQQVYIRLIEDAGTALVNILKTFAKEKKIKLIVGKSNQDYLKEFTGSELEGISRVKVDIGNPLTSTVAGKIQIAETCIQKGLFKNVQEYLQVIETGTYEPLMQGEFAELMCIKRENEELTDSTQDIAVQALVTDNHPLHILEHKAVLNSPDARRDPRVVQKALAHIMEHINLMKSADPTLLQLLGMPALPPTMPPQGPSPVGPMNNASSPLANAANAPAAPRAPSLPKGTPDVTANASQALNGNNINAPQPK